MNGTSEELFETYIYEFVFRRFFPNNFFGHFVQLRVSVLLYACVSKVDQLGAHLRTS